MDSRMILGKAWCHFEGYEQLCCRPHTPYSTSEGTGAVRIDIDSLLNYVILSYSI